MIVTAGRPHCDVGERCFTRASGMCRAPLPKKRLPSQRAAPEVRRAAAEAGEAERKEKQRSAELEKEPN